MTSLYRARPAVLYQAEDPPAIDGIRKPMKPGGYSDSGADIAFGLRSVGVHVVTPLSRPDPSRDADWVFPDSTEGIEAAIASGADTLWANTVLHDEHPLKSFMEHIHIVGQHPDVVHEHDDKWHTNTLLRQHALPVADSALIGLAPAADAMTVEAVTEHALAGRGLHLPLVVKPVRGRGSEGVRVVDRIEELVDVVRQLLEATVAVGRSSLPKYGDKVIVEEYLPNTEITVTVMPPGSYRISGSDRINDVHWAMPPVERHDHIHGVIPYNGLVAVTRNSRVVEQMTDSLVDIVSSCAVAASLVRARAPIRIDCRQRADGSFRIFDVNMKPNMTGPGRPGRDDQDSLTSISAQALGWSYPDLLVNMMRQAWTADGPAVR